MKLFTSFLFAATTVGMVVATYHDAPFAVRGGERRLVKNDTDTIEFDSMEVYYDPDGPECWLKYTESGFDEVMVDFDKDEIDEDNDIVRCTTKYSNMAFKGVEEDLPLYDATWVTEVVRDADVRWKDSKKLEVKIKRFREWEAMYDPDKKRPCVLKYKYGKDSTPRTEIEFKKSEVSIDGDMVTCKTRDVDDKLPIGHGLKELDKVIPNDKVDFAGYNVEEASVTWEKGDPLVLEIERGSRLEPVGREAFEDLDLDFDDFQKKVIFTYTPKCDGKEYELVFEGTEEVTRDGLKVTFESDCVEAPDCVELPIEFDFKVPEVTWRKKCDDEEDYVLVTVDSASFTWSDTCGSDRYRGRRLGKEGKPKGDVTAKG